MREGWGGIKRHPESREDAHQAFDRLVDGGVKYPKAAAVLCQDRDELQAFCDFPVARWQSIRTGNPIETTFAATRRRTKRSKAACRVEPWCA